MFSKKILSFIMVELPEFFHQTSDEPYDRHNYRFHFKDKQSIIFESYEEARAKWFNTPSLLKSHIEVLDKKQNTKFKGGFK